MTKPSPTKALELKITQEIIDRSVRRDSTACVLADALKIAMPGGVRPLVDLQTIAISVPEKGLRYHWLTPRAAQKILLNFDQGAELTPTVVKLRDGWTTKMVHHNQLSHRSKSSREERKAELAAKERAGLLTKSENYFLTKLRATDERLKQTKNTKADRADYAGRPPVASLSNANGRKYGLRLTRLTEHGQTLVSE